MADQLVAVTVWQETTYLVRPKTATDKDEIIKLVMDPTKRIAMVGQGKVNGQINKLEMVTLDTLEKARPTRPELLVPEAEA